MRPKHQPTPPQKVKVRISSPKPVLQIPSVFYVAEGDDEELDPKSLKDEYKY